MSYLALSALILAGTILRYPQSGHQSGVDSWTIDAIANMIRANGTIPWLISPLSYVGLAPFSYSPLVPVSLAEFGELAGIKGEAAVLAYSLFMGATIPLASFILGLTAFRRAPLALLVAFLISSATGMILYTTWTVSSRGTFLAFTPLAIALFLDLILHRHRTRKSGLGLALVLGTLTLTHAMFLILLPILAAAYVACRVVYEESRLMRHTASPSKRNRVAFATLILMGVGLCLLVALGPASITINGFPEVAGGFLPDNLVVRMGLQWVTVFGLGIVFLPLGGIRLSRLADSTRGVVLTSLLFAFLPLVLNPVYGVLVAIPALLLVVGLGILPAGLREKGSHRRGRTILIAAATCTAVVAAPLLVTVPRTSGVPCSEPDIINGQTYNTALYLEYAPGHDSRFVWDDHIEAQRIESVSGRPSLEPVESIGDFGIPWLAARMNIHYDKSPDLTDFFQSGHVLFNAQEWLSTAGAAYPYYWGKHTSVLLGSQLDSPTAQQILRFYRASYAVERCSTSATTFYVALDQNSYTVYADELQRIIWIQGYP